MFPRALYFALLFGKIFFILGVSGIDTIKEIWDGMDFSYLLSILLGLIPSLLCITLHELSHGYVAYLLGDDTAKNRGRLTLNPLKHLDPMGFLMMLVFHVGWAKPVPVNMWNFMEPKKGMALTALAGPMSNVLISIVFLFLYGASYYPLRGSAVGAYFSEMLELTAYISLGLAIFNLIPAPPLDGSKVLFSLIRDESYYKLMRYERYGSVIMLVLVATGALGRPLSQAISAAYGFLFPIAQWAADVVGRLMFL